MSPSDAAAVASHLAALRRRIEAACRRVGRDPASVTLVGASKLQPADALAAAAAAGLVDFGENRVQEGLAKAAELPAEIRWHLLGPLQSNKVRPALRLFRTFHAVDRLAIAFDLDREAGRLGLVIEGFLEVNLGGEASKHGFAPAGFTAAVAPLSALDHLRLVGLMAIPPWNADPESSRPAFARLRQLRNELAATAGWSGFRGALSMGMSDDFEVAIEEGATHVRVGTALFGPRHAPPC